ncbi:hypothetical protein RJ641_021263 [Dillenia turbinata]|uniref:Amine oxidase n=1 Tax=Dillenia turbinata TaxID=194707 RepID=A0AAN8UP16_9MAGN
MSLQGRVIGPLLAKPPRFESDARIQVGLKSADLIEVNPNKKTKVGNYICYRLIPGSAANFLLSADDYPQIHRVFTDHNSEKWACGLYADQSHGGDTLAIWSLRHLSD